MIEIWKINTICSAYMEKEFNSFLLKNNICPLLEFDKLSLFGVSTLAIGASLQLVPQSNLRTSRF